MELEDASSRFKTSPCSSLLSVAVNASNSI
jgi:hypothetical protein